jgi:hypothetical protein
MSSDAPSPLAVEEYRALRATIRERGTVRWIVIVLTFMAWGWAVSPVSSMITGAPLMLVVPLYSLVPLVVLAAGFETVFGLHVGVERVGRYLQARYEAADGSLPQWEHEAMAAGGVPELRSGIDPLVAWVFAGAAVLDLAPFFAAGTELPYGLTAGRTGQVLVSVVLHALFIARLFRARRFAAAQRDEDLRFFSRPRRHG